MSADLLIVAPSLLVLGVVAGSLIEHRLNVRMWKRHGYCPACDRLANEEPECEEDMREPGESFCSDCPDHEGCMQGIPCGLVKKIHHDNTDTARGN